MLRVHSFSLFTIETPRALIALTSFDILIVEKLKNVLQLLKTLLIIATYQNYKCIG